MLYNTIETAQELQREFRAYDRDNYSLAAYEAILDYFDECYPEGFELDVIGICCDFTEATLEEVANDYNLDTENIFEQLQCNTWAVETAEDTVLYINY